MVRKPRVAALAVLAAGALVLAGCGANKQEAVGSGSGTANCDTSKGTLVLGLIAPQTGGLSALGVGMKNSAKLAVDQANDRCAVKGYRLILQTQDDQATPQVGAQAASQLASDPDVAGVLGTLNSNVSQSVQPILAQKGIVQISPANTNPTLTRGQDYATAPKRQFFSYFRVCATDDLQGPFAANYLVGTAGRKKIAIIEDGKTYGVGLADEFAKQAAAKGAQVVDRERVGEKDTDFSGVITKIKPLAPNAVYYGGEYPVAGPLSKQMAAAGLDVPIMGGDGIYDPKFIELGGKQGDLATSVGAPAESQDSAKAFIDAYDKAGYQEAFSAYGAFTYDAANVVITSLAKTLANGGTWSEVQRPALLQNVQSYGAQGATGQVAFDQYGDSTNKLLTVYKVNGGKWVPEQTGTFQR